jgi:hypothetical protein
MTGDPEWLALDPFAMKHGYEAAEVAAILEADGMSREDAEFEVLMRLSMTPTRGEDSAS